MLSHHEISLRCNSKDLQVRITHLVQHAQEEILQQGRDLGPVWEPQGLILDHLEELEDVRCIEGDPAEDKSV